jgi:hypothetical protein
VLTAYEQGIRFIFVNIKWRYENKKEKSDFVAANKDWQIEAQNFCL